MNLRMNMNRPLGFTLIELMITVAVLGILAAIAYPNYEQYVRRSRMADCQTVVMQVASFADRFFTEANNNTYPTQAILTTRAPTLLTCPSGAAAGTQKYDITLTGGATYSISAAPASNYTETDCGTLTLTSANVKSSNGTKPNDYCWRR